MKKEIFNFVICILIAIIIVVWSVYSIHNLQYQYFPKKIPFMPVSICAETGTKVTDCGHLFHIGGLENEEGIVIKDCYWIDSTYLEQE